ncbi:hypothetical protein [Spirosoma endbachense]|uniref:Uncharacterized protein n=1 Tax=Spirosoma endbachense TaxID=2666025 RepID=A0A6P1WAD3_9BACT|nr:hypothetical protein [Spirosoma endbachense]QHW00940.1 hypothetical protein GJR95_40520 [Spirosoma endbachense]
MKRTGFSRIDGAETIVDSLLKLQHPLAVLPTKGINPRFRTFLIDCGLILMTALVLILIRRFSGLWPA